MGEKDTLLFIVASDDDDDPVVPGSEDVLVPAWWR
jgi:hypothetical protein